MSELLNIKGVGDAMLSKLNANHILSIQDLIECFPSRYEHHRIDSIHGVAFNETVTLRGTVTKAPVVSYIRRKLTKLSTEVDFEGVTSKVSIFNREFLRSALKVGESVVATGKFETTFKAMLASDLTLAKNYQTGILPVYGLEGIGDKVFAKLVNQALMSGNIRFPETLPDRLIRLRRLMGVEKMIKSAHHPDDEQDIQAISQRIKYDELLRFGLKIACLKRENDSIRATPKKYDIALVRKFIDSLPFELTEDQKSVTNDIFRDLKQPKPMLRLLQGDVGSGKTVCATIAAYAVVTGLEQVAFMAPTEILAFQHYQYLLKVLNGYKVEIAFLSSGVKGQNRIDILKGLSNGTINIIIGTHSLIQETIEFHKLGFVIIDEQHRFGVEQRKKLRLKGYVPDVLLMSATPIPRTLSIAIFGDMDISSIKSMPLGRKPIITRVTDLSGLDDVFNKVEEEVSKGRQAYFIVPVIEGKDDSPLIDVQELYDLIRSRFADRFIVENLHGKMRSEAKTSILERFYRGEISILVSTTVVEVGLNAPNATVMAVLNAERFGLSQLHQLRGRVGRSDHQSFCFFLSDQVLLGNDRLDILETTTDGFIISEEDLRQRGPGEVFGSEQTGIPRFKMANIINDEALLHDAFNDARTLFGDPDIRSAALVKKTYQSLDIYQLD